MSFRHRIRIEFNHCDPAGMVFYPRYFEMTNSACENFFDQVLGYPYSRIAVDQGNGVPTVHIEADFMRPSRLGDLVDFDLEVQRIGGSSVTFRITGYCGGEMRMRADITQVWMTTAGRAGRWPDDLRTGLERFQTQGAEA